MPQSNRAKRYPGALPFEAWALLCLGLLRGYNPLLRFNGLPGMPRRAAGRGSQKRQLRSLTRRQCDDITLDL